MSIYRVRTIFQGWIGGPGLMTNYFLGGTTPTTAEAQLAGDRVYNSLFAARGLFLDATNWKNDLVVDCFNEANGDLTTSRNITAVSMNGAGNTNLLPPSNQICVSFKTAGIRNNRRVRGRTFLGPLALSTSEGNGTPTADAMLAANTYATSIDDEGLTGLQHVIWARPPEGLSNGAVYPVTEYTIRDKFAVLRSRRD